MTGLRNSLYEARMWLWTLLSVLLVYVCVLVIPPSFELLVGYGEKTYSSDGAYDVIECVFFDNTPMYEGDWR